MDKKKDDKATYNTETRGITDETARTKAKVYRAEGRRAQLQ